MSIYKPPAYLHPWRMTENQVGHAIASFNSGLTFAVHSRGKRILLRSQQSRSSLLYRRIFYRWLHSFLAMYPLQMFQAHSASTVLLPTLHCRLCVERIWSLQLRGC